MGGVWTSWWSSWDRELGTEASCLAPAPPRPAAPAPARPQVFNICTSPIVQNAWDQGQHLAVHGVVYSVGDGVLRVSGGSLPLSCFSPLVVMASCLACTVGGGMLRVSGEHPLSCCFFFLVHSWLQACWGMLEEGGVRRRGRAHCRRAWGSISPAHFAVCIFMRGGRRGRKGCSDGRAGRGGHASSALRGAALPAGGASTSRERGIGNWGKEGEEPANTSAAPP